MNVKMGLCTEGGEDLRDFELEWFSNAIVMICWCLLFFSQWTMCNCFSLGCGRQVLRLVFSLYFSSYFSNYPFLWSILFQWGGLKTFILQLLMVILNLSLETDSQEGFFIFIYFFIYNFCCPCWVPLLHKKS